MKRRRAFVVCCFVLHTLDFGIASSPEQLENLQQRDSSFSRQQPQDIKDWPSVSLGDSVVITNDDGSVLLSPKTTTTHSSTALLPKSSEELVPVNNDNENTNFFRESVLHELLTQQTARRKDLFVTYLGILTGIAHVCCQNRYHYFGAMMTGTTIRMAVALSEFRLEDVALFSTLIVSYGCGASFFRLIETYSSSSLVPPLSPKTWLQKTKRKQSFVSTGMQSLDAASTRQLQATRSLATTSLAALLVFGVGDILAAKFLPQFDTTNQYRLAFLAIGFGMINAATQNCIQTVTNAVTGHITKAGMGLVDRWVRKLPNRDCDRSRNFVVTFATSICVSSFLYRWIQGFSERWLTGTRTLRIVQSCVPPFGTCFGILYLLVIRWYTSPVLRCWAARTLDSNHNDDPASSNGMAQKGDDSIWDAALHKKRD